MPGELLAEGRLSNGTVALMPFATVRLKQDLICLGQGRLRQVGERTEQVTISLTLGTLGWSFVPSNRPELRFKLLGENQRVVHEGTTPLGSDELKYGVVLGVPEGADDRRIFGTQLELVLNGVVLDRSRSAFIRSIRLSVKTKGA